MECFERALEFYVIGILGEQQKEKTGTMAQGYQDSREKMLAFFKEVGCYNKFDTTSVDAIILKGQELEIKKISSIQPTDSPLMYNSGFHKGISETVSAVMKKDYFFKDEDLIKKTV
jgi:hypothetical protein